MRKFGFGKKGSGDDGEDSNRSALFSRKKASPSPAPQSENPYARQGPPNDPYADEQKYANMTPYQQARADIQDPSRARPSHGGQDGQPPAHGGPHRASPGPGGNGYGAPPKPAGYGADRYGSGGGYGSSRYESNPAQGRSYAAAPPTRGPGGYGGLGRLNDNEPDENRDALFSGAQERHTQKQQQQQTHSAQAAYPGADADPMAGHGGYGEQRELTAEEQEEVEYQAILSEKRALQQESASSVNRSVQMAQQANEVGRATLARLGAQGERLHNTEKNLDLAANQNKVAQDRAAELKTLNRSMFAVHVGNPFTSKQRQLAADEEVMRRHHAEREQRESTRREGFQATQRMESNFRDISHAMPRGSTRKKDYGKFNLDDEEGANELEDQIDDGLNELEGQVSMMNMVGRAIGKEVDAQNKQIDRIMNKSDAVDDATRMNRERLARIK